jgi:predicted dehydrogenase
MSKPSLNRRRFLSTSASLAGGSIFAPNLMFGQGASANSKLRIACIGIDGKGASDSGAAAGLNSKDDSDINDIVAIVDVDTDRLAKAQKRFPGAKAYTDFRKMFDEMSDKIDAVTVSTPDHTHFVAGMMAVQHKKHVMVQKPMCNTIWEVRELHKAAKAAGVVTQMGNQGRTMEGQRLAKEWIEQGGIGTLKEIKLWTNRPIWPQGPIKKMVMDKPANLEWDTWFTSETPQPYFEFDIDEKQKKRGKGMHPFNWRGWWAYGSGALGDMGCHIMDATFSILGQAIPIKIEVESSEITAENCPMWTTLKYHFEATDKHPALVVTWQDGIRDGKPNKPEKHEFMADMKDEGWAKASSGMMFIGTEGIVFEGDAYCASPSIYPLARFTEVKQAMVDGKIKKTEARSIRPGEPQKEWTNIIKNGTGTPSSNFDYAAPLAEFVLLGNLAIRSQQTVQWDKAQMKVTNVEAANQFVKRKSYRPEWFKA